MYRLGLVALILLAGCSGGAGSAVETPTVTPAPVPSVTDSPTPAARLPPGISVSSGVTDPWLATTRSAELLSGTTYTRRLVEETRYANDTVRWRLERVTRVGENQSLVVETHRGEDRPGWRFASAERVAVFTVGGEDPARARSYWAITEEGATRYESFQSVGRTNDRTLFRLLSRFDTRLAGKTVRNGTVLYRIEAESRGEPKQMKYSDRTERARNVSLTVLVDRDGLIHQWRVAYTTVIDGTEVRYIRGERVAAIGRTTVKPPRWVDQLRESETPTPVAAGAGSSGADP